jgi:hypothetical protein
LDSIPEIQSALLVLYLSQLGVPIENALLLGQPLIDLRITQIQGVLLLGQPLIQLRIAKIVDALLLRLPLHELRIALLLGDIEASLLNLSTLNLSTLHGNWLNLTSLNLRSLCLGPRLLHQHPGLLRLNMPVLHLRPLVLLLQILLLRDSRRRCVCPDCGRRCDSHGEEKRARHPSDTLRNPCHTC